MEPVLLALLLADKVITEKDTNKRSIIGTFNNFWAAQFPASFPPWFVYVAFANVEGQHSLTVNIENRENTFNIYSANADFTSQDKTAQIEIPIPIVNARFPNQGKYEVSVSIDAKTLAARTLNVQARQGGGA